MAHLDQGFTRPAASYSSAFGYTTEDYRRELKRVERRMFWLTIVSILIAVVAIIAIVGVVLSTG